MIEWQLVIIIIVFVANLSFISGMLLGAHRIQNMRKEIEDKLNND